ncbi:hypothetical protein FQN55_007663 [Onygenales sp. PD_40]|nr:hypothetical protein FQN55_007663 [Onygenales sp. PD_40]KAK2770339.1 hypothetical protein FQN53_005627 [Emmonsiellopsis sp. PD_33]KAK2778545.1 hypothetical protein FQN52_002723 [Onygenales sp. PD_12]KAK2798517.1 hypothetical protein FQN51_007674 [Onygenales sp. PD_10]
MASPLFTVQRPEGSVTCTQPQKAVYLLTFNFAPDNRMTADFCQAMILALDIVQFKYPPGVVVTTSAIQKFYSNGLNLEQAIATKGFFENNFFALFKKLLTYPMPTVALVNGHAFAGGFMCSMYHDFRIFNPSRGFLCLNEVHFGANLKPAMSSIFREKIATPNTYRTIVLEGYRFGGKEALENGIVDGLGGLDEVLALIEKRKLTKLPASGVYGQLRAGMFPETMGLLERCADDDALALAELERDAKEKENGGRRVEEWAKRGGKASKLMNPDPSIDKNTEDAEPPPQHMGIPTPTTMGDEVDTTSKGRPPLLLVPSEILYLILSNLPAPSLVSTSATCRSLRKHAQADILWMPLVNNNLPTPLTDPAPFPSFRELYASQFPMWFVARNMIWISDAKDTGKLMIARYNPRRCQIEGFRVVAAHRIRQFESWTYDRDVLIHSFKPQVSLWMGDPVLELAKSTPPLSRKPYEDWRRNEIRMPMATEAQRIFNSFMLCKKVTAEEDDTDISVWPPRIIPSDYRADVSYERYLSFQAQEDKPQRLEEVCESAFRLKRWMRFGNLGTAFDIGTVRDGISTYGTLRRELYTPTREKPYQGIWVGDYSGHGSEFLLVLQRDGHSLSGDEHATSENADTVDDSSSSTYSTSQDSSMPLPSGRLEAIKLTGDPNVPRGEITFYADDIGQGGLIRIADEEIFRGARVVHSKGHIASTNFRDDKFIPSQLLLISHDCMAHFWEELKHISYYRRVDLDALIMQDLD